MIPKLLVLVISCQSIFCYPQHIIIPDIRNKAQPAEINSLEQHNHHPRSIASASNLYSQNNVEDTIKEVDAMLKANPTLPRLTRGEILDLLENITKTDMAKGKVENKNQETKVRDPKAIMVVMPFTPSNGNDVNMEELFTKPPVTHIVGAEPFRNTEKDYTFKRLPEEIVNIPELGKIKKYSSEKDKSSRINIAPVLPTPASPPETKDPPLPPQYSAKKTSHRRRPPPSNSKTPTLSPTTYHPTRRPVRRRTTTTTERYPNHKYPDEATSESVKEVNILPSTGIRIIEAPKLAASDINEDLQMQENQQQDVFVKQPEIQPSVSFSKKEPEVSEVDELKVISTSISPFVDLVPDNLKGILKGVNLQFEQPIKSTTSAPTTKLTKEEEEEKIRNMLASFGVLPVKTTTTTTQVPDISNVADNLTPEMRDLLMSFGLIPEANEKSQVAVSPPTKEVYDFNPVKAEVKPDAYVGFKPLPEEYSSRDDMEELLSRFGLGRNGRKEKALEKKEEDEGKKEETAGLNFEAVPEQYLGVLEDIGLADRQGKMISSAALVKTQEKQHVFNPGEPQYSSAKELEKLTRLLEVVKQIEKLNGSVSDDDLKKIDTESLKELIASLNEESQIVPLDMQNAPNPINYDLGLEKNEIKRQENSTTTTTASPSTTSTTETQTANIKDLEASFGGQVDASPASEEPVPETTTEARKTGFYYLVDWNTFLDIDDQKGKRVNLRFQPKVGDPSRFYSVNVP